MDRNYRDLLRYTGLATQWAVLLLLAVWGGIQADRSLAWSFPVFTLVFPLAAICVALWKLIKDLGKKKKT